MPNLVLKGKIVERYRIQGAAAKAWRMSESRLSRIISGLSDPTDEELALFAASLGPEVAETIRRNSKDGEGPRAV